MKRGRTFAINMGLLTGVSLLMRAVGLAFQVYLSNRIGAEEMGLYYLVVSVHMFAATFAISGSRFATTRLVSEKIGTGDCVGARRAVSSALRYALAFSCTGAALLFFGADWIGTRLIGDERTVLSLRILALGLPPLALGAVLGGYFTAVCRVAQSAAAQTMEDLVRIAVVVLAFTLTGSGDAERDCALIVSGGVLGELLSFFFIWALYARDVRRYLPCRQDREKKREKRLAAIAMPLAVTAYVRTALSAVQNLLVPRGLRRAGASAQAALAEYGVIQGMVFPVITFPAALFSSLAELVVPELTDAQVQGDTLRISESVTALLRASMITAVWIMACLFWFSDGLSGVLYHGREVGHSIRALSFLMPLMFLDTVTDGMLRGLNQHMYSMKYNVIDSCLSTVLIYFLIPLAAVRGYLFVLYFSEAFNFFLSFRRLSRVAKPRIRWRKVAEAVLCAVGAVNAAGLFLYWIGLPENTVWGLVLRLLLSGGVYALLLQVTGCVTRREVARIRARLL